MQGLSFLVCGIYFAIAVASDSNSSSLLDYVVKGVAYSPVPIGEHPHFSYPYGDYFISAYKNLWKRDFPAIKALGANTLRLYSWRSINDHTEFLDMAHSFGLKVLPTFYMDSKSTPLNTEKNHNKVIENFVKEVRRYAKHPAIYGWSIGNEINAIWNGFLPQFNEVGNCSWKSECFDKIGKQSCIGPRICLYREMTRFLNEAATKAKEVIREENGVFQIMTSAFADVDDVLQMLTAEDFDVSEIDVWGMNLYKGHDFGIGEDNVLEWFPGKSGKPLIVTEFGVDAYSDPCGVCLDASRNAGCPSPCYNTLEDGETSSGAGFGEDEISQAAWTSGLASIMLKYWGKGVLGGFAMSWVDEYWKNSDVVAGCTKRILNGKPTIGECDFKAHIDCPHEDPWKNALCGHFFPNTFDSYVNEGWFGINRPKFTGRAGHDSLIPRKVFYDLAKVYGGSGIIEPLSHGPLYSQPWFIVAIILLSIGLLPIIIQEVRTNMCKCRPRSVAEADLFWGVKDIVGAAEEESLLPRGPKIRNWSESSD